MIDRTLQSPTPLPPEPSDMPDEQGFVTRRIGLHLDRIIEAGGIEGFDDLVLEEAGDPLGEDISYEVVGVEPGNLLVLDVKFFAHAEDDGSCLECHGEATPAEPCGAGGRGADPDVGDDRAENDEAVQGACILTPENMHTADDCTLHDHER